MSTKANAFQCLRAEESISYCNKNETDITLCPPTLNVREFHPENRNKRKGLQKEQTNIKEILDLMTAYKSPRKNRKKDATHITF